MVSPCAGQQPDGVNMRKFWTPQQDKTLKRLMSEGFSHKGAARIMKRTPEAITKRVAHIKTATSSDSPVKSRHWLQSEDDILRQMTIQGDSEWAIGRAIGRSKSAVRSRRLALNITAPKQDQGFATKIYRGDDEKFLKLLHKHHPNQYNVAKRSDDGMMG